MINHSDPTIAFEACPLPISKCEYVDDVIRTIHTDEQYEKLISINPLDDALGDFLTSCGSLNSIVESKEVDEWIDLHIDKDLNE